MKTQKKTLKRLALNSHRAFVIHIGGHLEFVAQIFVL